MINYLIDSENMGTKWISYLDENIEELDKAFLFYTDASKSISCKELSVLFSFIRQLETIHCQNGTANALDFQLVSYLGYLIRMDTKSTYCILFNFIFKLYFPFSCVRPSVHSAHSDQIGASDAGHSAILS